MDKECVLNELSILSVKAGARDLRALLEGLLALKEVVRPASVYLWQDFRDPDTPLGKHFDELRAATRPTRHADKDAYRRLWRFFDTAVQFADELPHEVMFGRDQASGAAGEQAHGLGLAHALGALALSVAVEERWNKAWLSVDLVARGLPDEPSVEVGKAAVRHAGAPLHVVEHVDWQPLDNRDRLRARLSCRPTSHKPASSYCGGKHVRGRTNAERLRSARGPAGNAQYMAEINGVSVSDATVQRWEARALEEVRTGEGGIVDYRAHTFHVFCDLGEPVGYAAVTGELISWVRVEWSSGNVHSHPHLPPKSTER